MRGVSWKWVRSIGSIDEKEEREEGERGFVDRFTTREKNRIVLNEIFPRNEDRPARD